MSKNERLLQMLKDDEGLRLKPYRCTANKITIGYGRNLYDVGISPDEAEMLLNNDIIRAKLAVKKHISNFDRLSENRKAVLINMCFNLGALGFSKFKKMIHAIKIEDFNEAAIQMKASKWYNQVTNRAERLIRLMKNG